MIEHLSVSSINDFQLCITRWYGRKVAKWPEQPTYAQQFGAVVHKALEIHHSGGDPELGLIKAWRSVTNPDKGGREKAQRLIDKYTAMNPHAAGDWTEFWIRVPIPGLGIPLVGTIDLGREDGSIWDYKTTSSGSWTQQKVDTELQATAYWWAIKERLGTDPERFVYVRMNTRTEEVRLLETQRTQDDLDAFLELCRHVYPQMVEVAAEGPSEAERMCPEGWCPWPERCGVGRHSGLKLILRPREQ